MSETFSNGILRQVFLSRILFAMEIVLSHQCVLPAAMARRTQQGGGIGRAEDTGESDSEQWREQLNREMERLGRGSAARLAQALNMSEGQISKRRSGAIRIKFHEWRKMKRFFETHAGGSHGGDGTAEARTGKVIVAGYIGAGDRTHEYFFDPGEFEEIEPPGIMGEDTVALAIRGDSLGPAFNGGYVFYDKAARVAPEAMIGRLCVIGTTDGAAYVKTLQPGSSDGTYNLLSSNAATIDGVRIQWATPVLAVAPRRGKFPPRLS